MLAAGVALLGVLLSRHRGPTASGSDGAFVCPMHLDVTSAAAGTCPICGMALVKARSLPRDGAGQRREDGASEDSIAIAQILSRSANGVADNLVGYYPAALRDHFFRYEAMRRPGCRPTATSRYCCIATSCPRWIPRRS